VRRECRRNLPERRTRCVIAAVSVTSVNVARKPLAVRAALSVYLLCTQINLRGPLAAADRAPRDLPYFSSASSSKGQRS
jgi:hypothetical protein